MPKITVGLVVYNEGPNILECLRSISANRLDLAQLIVVDHGSVDGTFELIQSWADNTDIDVILWRDPTNNLGRSRARIVHFASTPWVAFTDGDCIVPPNWLQKLWEGMAEIDSEKLRGGVCGEALQPEHTAIGKKINLMLESPFGGGTSPQAARGRRSRKVDHLPTTNALFNRAAVLAAGNFSTQFGRVGEDLDLGLRLGRHGYEMWMVVDCAVQNASCSSLREWLNRMLRFGSAQSQAIIGHQHWSRWPRLLPVINIVPLPALLLALFFSAEMILFRHRPWRLVLEAAKLLIITHFFYAIGIILGCKNMLSRIQNVGPQIHYH